MVIIHDKACTEYSHPGHPERPERILGTEQCLRAQKEIELTWVKPSPAEDEALLRAHSREYLDSLSAGHDFDMDTPYFPNIAKLARLSAGAAVAACKAGEKGSSVFSLMRPPGHHACKSRAMGFCYINNIAVAVLDALARGSGKVAVFDFDVHHGNGTETILLNHPKVTYCSVHQFPCYPGTGTRNVGQNCFNYPVPPQTVRPEYRHILTSALDQLAKSKPALIAVSAGFDAYARDPLAQGTLEAEDFYTIGKLLRQLSTPIFSLLEGGYSQDLPQLVLAYLRGLAGK